MPPKPQGKEIEIILVLEKFGPNSKWRIKVEEEDFSAVIFQKAVEMKLMSESSIATSTLLYKEKEMSPSQTIASYKMSLNPTVFIYNSNNLDKYYADISMVPKCTREDFIFTPDFVDICRMTEEELKAVSNFSIENEHGRIDFLDTVDLRNVDFDRDVNIEHKYIEVYGNISPEHKPKKGEALNQSAQITFFNFKKKESMTSEKFLRILKNYAKKMKAELLGYDEENYEVSIVVNNF